MSRQKARVKGYSSHRDSISFSSTFPGGQQQQKKTNHRFWGRKAEGYRNTEHSSIGKILVERVTRRSEWSMISEHHGFAVRVISVIPICERQFDMVLLWILFMSEGTTSAGNVFRLRVSKMKTDSAADISLPICHHLWKHALISAWKYLSHFLELWAMFSQANQAAFHFPVTVILVQQMFR